MMMPGQDDERMAFKGDFLGNYIRSAALEEAKGLMLVPFHELPATGLQGAIVRARREMQGAYGRRRKPEMLHFCHATAALVMGCSCEMLRWLAA